MIILNIARNLYLDSHSRNSISLMLSSLLISFLGFVFWAIVTRLYTAEAVGIATTLFSSVTFLSSLSFLGFNASIIKYFGRFKNKNDLMNTTANIVFLSSIITALIFLLLIPIASKELLFIQSSLSITVLFISLVVTNSLNSLTDNIFIGARKSHFTLIINSVLSIIRLSLPLFLISLGAIGLLISIEVSILAALITSLYLMYKYLAYIPRLYISKNILLKIKNFSSTSYFTNIINDVSSMIIPILILNKLGAEIAAFYYFPNTIVSLLSTIPRSISSSLLAETNNESDYLININKTIKLLSLTLLPAGILTIFAGKYILLFFGSDYSTQGILLLQLTTISLLLASGYYVSNTLLYLDNRLKLLLIITGIKTILSISITFLYIPLGLEGVGIARIVTETIFLCISILIIKFILKSKHEKSTC